MTTPYEIAQRYIGLREISAQGRDHPFIQWCFTLCGYDINTPDEIGWCSAFAQHPAWELHLSRSKSAAARSWLRVGVHIPEDEAAAGYDVVILNRGGPVDPEADGPGHVGYFGGWDGNSVLILGGNQGNEVSLRAFPRQRILGIRRLRLTRGPA